MFSLDSVTDGLRLTWDGQLVWSTTSLQAVAGPSSTHCGCLTRPR